MLTQGSPAGCATHCFILRPWFPGICLCPKPGLLLKCSLICVVLVGHYCVLQEHIGDTISQLLEHVFFIIEQLLNAFATSNHLAHSVHQSTSYSMLPEGPLAQAKTAAPVG